MLYIAIFSMFSMLINQENFVAAYTPKPFRVILLMLIVWLYININKLTFIYLIVCEDNKYYIGKTTNYNKRFAQHFNGTGAKVTQKFKPLNCEVVDTCPGYFSDKLEQKHTDKNIKKYGYNNVRGGKYVNSKTLNKNSYSEDSY